MERRNVKMVPLSTDAKPLLLRKLQGSFFFETTLTAATAAIAGNSSGLTIPSWFIQDHGHKFGKSTTLRMMTSRQTWPVTLSLWCPSQTMSQVRFCGGWQAFATFHGLRGGDLLLFVLKAASEFKVYLFRDSEGPNRNPPPKRTRRSTATSDRSQKQVENQERNDEQMGAEGEGSDNTSVALNRRSIAVHDCAIAPIPPSGSKPCLHHLPRLWKTLTASNGGEQSGKTTDHGANRRSITIYECAIAPVPPSGRKACLYHFPSFWKTLTASNVCQNAGAALEFPEEFWRTYGSRIDSLVKLQGIHEQSPVRTMVCCISLGRGTRYYLRAEWRTFVKENHLREGQQLLFTLSADSFFVVRELSAI